MKTYLAVSQNQDCGGTSAVERKMTEKLQDDANEIGKLKEQVS